MAIKIPQKEKERKEPAPGKKLTANGVKGDHHRPDPAFTQPETSAFDLLPKCIEASEGKWLTHLPAARRFFLIKNRISKEALARDLRRIKN